MLVHPIPIHSNACSDLSQFHPAFDWPCCCLACTTMLVALDYLHRGNTERETCTEVTAVMEPSWTWYSWWDFSTLDLKDWSISWKWMGWRNKNNLHCTSAKVLPPLKEGSICRTCFACRRSRVQSLASLGKISQGAELGKGPQFAKMLDEEDQQSQSGSLTCMVKIHYILSKILNPCNRGAVPAGAPFSDKEWFCFQVG